MLTRTMLNVFDNTLLVVFLAWDAASSKERLEPDAEICWIHLKLALRLANEPVDLGTSRLAKAVVESSVGAVGFEKDDAIAGAARLQEEFD